MNDATHGAENIRNDISALAQRYAVIDRDEECGVCKRKILIVGGDYRSSRSFTSVRTMAPFYVFPCGHAFRAHYLIAHVTWCTNEAQAEYILDLQKQLTLLGDGARKDLTDITNEESIATMTPADKFYRSLQIGFAHISIVLKSVTSYQFYLQRGKGSALCTWIAGFMLLFYFLGVLVSQPELPLSSNGIVIKFSGESAVAMMSLL